MLYTGKFSESFNRVKESVFSLLCLFYRNNSSIFRNVQRCGSFGQNGLSPISFCQPYILQNLAAVCSFACGRVFFSMENEQLIMNNEQLTIMNDKMIKVRCANDENTLRVR
jgi:hypothetical protein